MRITLDYEELIYIINKIKDDNPALLEKLKINQNNYVSKKTSTKQNEAARIATKVRQFDTINKILFAIQELLDLDKDINNNSISKQAKISINTAKKYRVLFKDIQEKEHSLNSGIITIEEYDEYLDNLYKEVLEMIGNKRFRIEKKNDKNIVLCLDCNIEMENQPEYFSIKRLRNSDRVNIYGIFYTYKCPSCNIKDLVDELSLK